MLTKASKASLALVSLALSACGGGRSPAPGPSGPEQRSDKLRITAPVVSEADAAALAAGNLAFAVDMHAQLRAMNGGKNFIFSQTSISTALAMLYAGARNQTATQMAAALHFTLPPERLHPAFNALDLALTAPAGDDAAAFRLKVANSTWVQQGFPALPGYLDLLAENYGAGLFTQDFATAAEPARETINAWVADRTEDQIKELFPQGTINGDTVLVLANAIFFHGDWVKPFEKDSRNGTFHAAGGDVSVPMMFGDHVGALSSGTGWSAVRLDYVGGTTSMLVVVPDAGTFDAFEAGLTADTLASVLAAPSTICDVGLPRFKFQTATALKNPLMALGMTDAFGAADLSGIDGTADLVVQAVVHQATIAVDEKGTTASAATGVSVGVTSVPLSLRVDRPFLFFIVHRPTNAVLFQGRVLDPSK
jgi:serpin B